MGRIRTIKPEFWKSRPVGRLPLRARLAFIWTWNEADDCGRLEWDPAIMRAGAFMFDELSLGDAEDVMAEIAGAGLVVLYTVDGKAYAEIKGWLEHQRIKKPSAPRCPSAGLREPR